MIDFFNKLRETDFKKFKNGKQFEKYIGKLLKECGFRNTKNKNVLNFLQTIKKDVLNDCLEELILPQNMRTYNGVFVYEPYGSQSFPDYILFYDKHIIPLEIKFSYSTKQPLWNGSLPKEHSIYIFASNKFNDVTYFKGSDVITKSEREFLNNVWNLLNDHVETIKDKYNFKNAFGFDIYLRKTFMQNKKNNKDAILDYFKNKKREGLETNVELIFTDPIYPL